MNMVVYTKSNCPNCTTAKQLLKDKKMNYDEFNVEYNPALLDDLPPGVRQMPQIFYKGERIGGLAGLQAWLKWKEEQ